MNDETLPIRKQRRRTRFTRIRWTLEQAASEFGIGPKTLSMRVKTGGIDPESDGSFTTASICKAVFGDFQGEKLRKLREEADFYAIRNAQAKGELVPADKVRQEWEGIVLLVREKFLSLPGKVEARYQVGMTGVDLRQLMDREVDEVLQELSRPVPKESVVES